MRVLTLTILFLLGVGATLVASNTLREDAQLNWENKADQVGQWLTGSLLGWLEESYAPLSGLAALSENSVELSETEFLNAYDGLEARASAFFLEGAALVALDAQDSDTPHWQIKYTTDPLGILKQDAALEAYPEILEAVQVAQERFGEIILGHPIEATEEGSRISPIALGTYDATGTSIVVGLVDYGAITKGLFDLHVPKGLAIKIEGRFPKLKDQGELVHVLGNGVEDQLHSLTMRTVSAGAELSITWDFAEEFNEGPSEELADYTLIFGFSSSLIFTFFVGFLLRQNQVISQRVEAATEDLEGKTVLLKAVMGSITQGLVAYDDKLSLIVSNERFRAIRDVPEEFMQAGSSFEEWIRFDTKRGEFGDANPNLEAQAQVNRAKLFASHSFERTRPNGSVIEVAGGPLPHGGFVSTYTDITERKMAERKLKNAYAIISDSIEYASRIQRSLLTSDDVFNSVFKQHLIFWEPRDIVGGDIYHYRKCQNGHLIMVIDCTGHGVPGAFMTIIVTGALDQALLEIPTGDPARLLQRINQLVKTILGQDTKTGESDDGFEAGLCLINPSSQKMTYAGARIELWTVLAGELSVLKGDKTGIGYCRTPHDQQFSNHHFYMEDGAQYYLTTDGLIDQIGNQKRRSLGKRRLKKIISDHAHKSMAEQKTEIMTAFSIFQGDEIRRDDITLVGFKCEDIDDSTSFDI